MSDPQAGAAHEESFISHLVELRDRLLRSLIAVGVVLGALCLYPGPGAIYDFLAAPLTAALPEGTKMIAIGVITPFMVPLKVTAMVAFVLALPFILYQVWSFVAPGLYAHEKRLGIPLIVSSTLLFMSGMAFCYFFVFGQVFSFINSFAPKSITPAPDIEAYLSFVMTMFLAFGLAFEVPIAVVVLARIGVVTVAQEVRPQGRGQEGLRRLLRRGQPRRRRLEGPRLRRHHRRHRGHAARCRFPVGAGSPDVPAVRVGYPGFAPGVASGAGTNGSCGRPGK